MSEALTALELGIEEVAALERASPLLREGIGNPSATRALGRSAVVLLSSHLERFIYGLFECASSAVCEASVGAEHLPVILRLEHARSVIDDISSTSWDRRDAKLVNFSAEEAQLWVQGQTVDVIYPDRLLTWMKSPDPKAIVRAFRMWGIQEIFTYITRIPSTRAALRFGLTELVEKRNNIAHGDFTTEATISDVRRYRAAVRKFGGSADRAMAVAVRNIIGSNDRPW